ncbi:hypothetical protein CC2G_001920 [Coprinopsis cinerea AmutBmut pab1-1]|nr:hypothetical protein CC2G_001920 [Coprinopsis cinerea AmutBmut pab1-1]
MDPPQPQPVDNDATNNNGPNNESLRYQETDAGTQTVEMSDSESLESKVSEVVSSFWFECHLRCAYPRPTLKTEFIRQSCAQLITEKNGHLPDGNVEEDEFLEAFDVLFYRCELRTATEPGTGLPKHLPLYITCKRIKGPEIWLEVKSICDIGISGFTLERIRLERQRQMFEAIATAAKESRHLERDEIDALRRSLPKFPRGTLLFTLSDGHEDIDALELEPLPGFSLESTYVGHKIQVRDLPIICGKAFLTSSNIVAHGARPYELWDDHNYHLQDMLRARLGREVRFSRKYGVPLAELFEDLANFTVIGPNNDSGDEEGLST